MPKNKIYLTSNSDVRKQINEGIMETVEAVASTLGPAGRKALIEDVHGLRLTKDGVSVAQKIDLSDPIKNVGASLAKKVANNTLNAAGDGTSSASVLFGKMVDEGIHRLERYMNPVEIANGMHDALNTIIKELNSIAIDIKGDKSKAEQVASVASGDKQIGQMIANASEYVGPYGLITVDDAKSVHTSLETSIGAELSNGYISRFFVNNREKRTCELDEPYILVCDHKIGSAESLAKLLEPIARSGKSLLIVAEEVDGSALQTLIINTVNGAIKACAIKSPGFGDNKKHTCEDVAILTGAKYISKELIKLEDVSIEDLGRADKVVIHQDKTIIIGGKGNDKDIENRRDSISQMIKEASDYEKENLEKRRARLAKGIAVLKVGAVTEMDQKELKDRVEDAVLALKSALNSGVLPGGGISLIYASEACKNLLANAKNKAYSAGIEIVQSAAKAPFMQNLTNAGKAAEAPIILNDLQSSNNKNMGYDSFEKGITDMVEAGIIDSLNSVVSGIQYATHTAISFLTSQAFIINDPEAKEKNDGPMPNMGGMY